jgi:hypothetical protein
VMPTELIRRESVRRAPANPGLLASIPLQANVL